MKIKLPAWLRRSKLQLPDWAKVSASSYSESGRVALVIEADTDAAYTEWFELLGNPPKDQYWLEAAYQCIKLDMQAAIAGTEYDPRIGGKPVEFRFVRSDAWAQKLHPVGRGSEAAGKGKEARGHYVRIRGTLPM